MIDKYHNKRKKLLGMSIGKANHKLIRTILFKLIQECKRDMCFRCSDTIQVVEDMSIEHKEAWMSSEDPIKTFFDLDNISFSHKSCNYAAASKPTKKYFTKEVKLEAYRKRDLERWHNSNRAEERRQRIKNKKKFPSSSVGRVPDC